MDNEKKSDIQFRFLLVYICMCLFAFCIIGRIVQLQFFKVKELKQIEQVFTQKEAIIEAKRGDIYARDGRFLAISIPFYDIFFDGSLKYVTNKDFYVKLDSIATGLSNIFKDKTMAEYRQLLQDARKNEKRYTPIFRHASYSQFKELKRLPIFKLPKNKSGLIVDERSNQRVMPFLNLASRTVGYMSENENGEKSGTVGLEQSYDNELRGVKGYTKLEKISSSLWMPINDGSQIEPKDGLNIISTINVDVQDVAQTALVAAVDSNNADHGCAILMEVATGEVLAIANAGRNKDGKISAENFNYAIGESAEPGSTFKAATLMVDIEGGYVEPTDTVDTQGGVVEYYGAKMKDSHEGGYGRISVQHALELSSNVGVSKVITQHYRGKEKEFVSGLYNLRLNVPLGLEIKGEGIPYIKDPSDKYWSGVSLPWMSIGYEVHITPMQLLTFYNAIANDGKMVKPRFVKEIRDKDVIVEEKQTIVLQPSICSKATLEKVKRMLEGVVLRGTASNIKNPNYSIAGKTGTCVLNYWEKTQKKKYQASFVGYFPADKPKYSCIVVINNPSKGSYYGAVVAGSVFKGIADKIFSTTLEIQPDIGVKFKETPKQLPTSIDGNKDDIKQLLSCLKLPLIDNSQESEWVSTERTNAKVEIKPKLLDGNIVPNLKGMGIRDALYVLENKGIQVKIIGKGYVVKQSIQPGATITKGQEIIIELGQNG